MAVCAFTIDEYDPNEKTTQDLSMHMSLHDLNITLGLQR
jgi:hypothetical protein